MSKPDYVALATEIGTLVEAKNAAYGSSFAKCGDFLRILYPDGIAPAQYQDALLIVRIFDKLMRIATAKDALGESPYRDITGYGLLGAAETPPKRKWFVPDATDSSLSGARLDVLTCFVCGSEVSVNGWVDRTGRGEVRCFCSQVCFDSRGTFAKREVKP